MGQRYPLPITQAMLADSNANEGKPRYDSMTDWAGGNVGDDVTYASACVALADGSGRAPGAAYTPRTQSEKGASMVPPRVIVDDISRARGSIAPNQRYPVAGDAAVPAPTITSLTPNTAPVGSPTLGVVITGTGFTAWSKVRSGNYPISSKYISPTQLQIYEKPWASVAGTVTIVVTDHNVDSNASNFVFT